jgi:hypothetical protein
MTGACVVATPFKEPARHEIDIAVEVLTGDDIDGLTAVTGAAVGST